MNDCLRNYLTSFQYDLFSNQANTAKVDITNRTHTPSYLRVPDAASAIHSR